MWVNQNGNETFTLFSVVPPESSSSDSLRADRYLYTDSDGKNHMNTRERKIEIVESFCASVKLLHPPK